MASRRSSRRLFLGAALLAAPPLLLGRRRAAAQAGGEPSPRPALRIPKTFGENLRGKQLADTAYKDLLWPGASFRKLKASRVRFSDAVFHGCDWGGAELDAVTFERCALNNCDLSAATLRGCSFVDCEIAGFGGKTSALLDTRFVRTRCEGLLIDRGKLDGVSFEAGALRQATVTHSEVGALRLSKTALERLELHDNKGATLSLTLDACEATGLSVRGGFKRLHTRAGSLTNWMVHDARAEELLIEDAASIFDLRLSELNARRIAILRPAGQVDFDFRGLTTPQLELTQGSFLGHLENSTLGKGSRISKAKLVSVFWDASKLDGVVFDDVTFEDAIVARNVHFTELKLNNVHYAAKLELMLEGSVFERSDRFQGK